MSYRWYYIMLYNAGAPPMLSSCTRWARNDQRRCPLAAWSPGVRADLVRLFRSVRRLQPLSPSHNRSTKLQSGRKGLSAGFQAIAVAGGAGLIHFFL